MPERYEKMKISRDRYSKAKTVAKSYWVMKHRGEPTPKEIDEMQAVEKALAWIATTKDGEARERAMRGLYVDGKSLDVAAQEAGYTSYGVRPTHSAFIRKLAEYLGY